MIYTYSLLLFVSILSYFVLKVKRETVLPPAQQCAGGSFGHISSTHLRQLKLLGARRRVQGRRLRADAVFTYCERSQTTRGKQKYKQKEETRSRFRERVSTLIAFCCAEISYRAKSINGLKALPFCFPSCAASERLYTEWSPNCGSALESSPYFCRFLYSKNLTATCSNSA